MTDEMTGTIFDIQRYSIHDGPGIRTLVFMKGCSLGCRWCSNPEGQQSHPEIRFIAIKCVGKEQCHAPCIQACPNAAISLSREGKLETDRKLCQNCGACSDACLYGARQLSGRQITVEELLAEVNKDAPFYRNSGGGVTVGGGEPIRQFEFTRAFLKRCKEHYLHTAIETCGHVPWRHLQAALKFVDLVYYDIKHMDPVKHKDLSGASNSLILKNARALLSSNQVPVIIRVPIVPGCNDSDDNIKATAKFVTGSGGKLMELLPYHRLGISKYGQLDKDYELREVSKPTEEHMQRLKAMVKSLGIEKVTGAI
ncbi:glycyl-radical enzyme activating protein [Chloroflexota bacterium]